VSVLVHVAFVDPDCDACVLGEQVAAAGGCGGDCEQTPGRCPERQSIGPSAGSVKSRAGKRTIGMPPQLVSLLRAHQLEQQREKAAARQLWHEEDWVFATQTGQPINPRTDYNDWKRLLRDAGLREGRLHDARHTAATVLLILRQPTPTVMSLMGWSSESMAARYQHVTDALRSQVASQVGELIWKPVAEPDNEELVAVRRSSLVTVLTAVAEQVERNRVGQDPADELLAAIAHVRAALGSGTEARSLNETKTETTRPTGS
jgi:Phage integrase family